MLPSNTIVLVERLTALLPNDFTKMVLSGSLRALQDDNNPIRVNLFALAIREMVRHVLDMRAPEADVRSCTWFKEAMKLKLSKASEQERRSLDIVTRKDRMIYATQGGLRDELLAELHIDTQGMHDALLATVRKLSKHVHMEPSSMLPPSASVVELANEVLTAVAEFLEAVDQFRAEIGEAVSGAVNDEALDSFLRATYDSLDELSTHMQVDGVEVDAIKVIGIGASKVYLEASGTVYVELVYGSGADERRGDGARISDNYPFTMMLSASTTDLKDLQSGQGYVNTDSFYGLDELLS